MNIKDKTVKCEMCNKVVPKTDVKLLQLVSPLKREPFDAYVCTNCRRTYLNMDEAMEQTLFDSKEAKENDFLEDVKSRMMAPKELYDKLSEVVKGQDAAKKTMSVAVYNHYARICNQNKLNGSKIKKNNVIMVGGTGTGKTLIAEVLADILGVPFTIASSTSLSETGYVGNDVESILSSLLKAANMDVEKAQYGIVFLDEVDKIAKASKENMSITRDVSGEGVQKALLKMVEGCKVGVSESGGRIHPHQKLIEIDTTNILFICAGAFEGIEDIVSRRLQISNKRTNSMGFASNPSINDEDKKALTKLFRSRVDSVDLEKFGMISELLGRLPIVCNLEPLTKEHLIEILKSKTGIIEEYKSMLMLQGKKLIFEDDTLGVIADFALNRGYGARGLRHVLGKIMENVLFESPTDLDTNTYIITTDYVRDKVYTLDKRFIEISSIVRECIYDIREHLNLQENSFAYNNDMVEEIATVFYKEDIGCDRILEIMSSHKIINDKVVKYGFAEDEMYEKLNEYIIENIKK